MELGIVATHVPPAKGYGGVAVTCGVLTGAWAERGIDMALVASDESISGRLKPEDVRLGDSVVTSLYRCYGFKRWGFGLGAIPKLFKLCRQAPVVYIHGIATWPTTLAAVFCCLLRRPFMVAAHGGLMPEHVAWIRRRKPHKWLFYRWLTFPTLRRSIAVHCTSDTEVQGVRAVLGDDAQVLQVANGIASRSIKVGLYPPGIGLKLCFLGHIQQEKGINAFIKAWLQIRRPNDRLVIAGHSVDGAYFKEFQALIEQAQGAIDYRGYIRHDAAMQLLAASHFLVLPSGLEASGGMRENFGNVVAEALAAGRPVLAAKGLAWDRLQAFGMGFIFERTPASAQQAIEKAQSLNRLDWVLMSSKCRQYAERQLDPVQLGDLVWKALQPSVRDNRQQALEES